MILGLKLLKNREKSSDLVPLVYNGWLFRVISEKAATYIIKAMSNLIISAVIVCNHAPDITPYPEAKWVNHMGLLDKISCFSIWETVTGCVPCWLLQKIYSKNFSAVWLQIFKVHSSVVTDQSKRWQQSFPQRKHHHHQQQQQKKHPKTKARMLGCHLNIYTYTPQNISGSQNVSTHMAIVSIPGIRWLREENRCFSSHYCTCMSSTRQNTSIVKSGIF